MHLNAALAQTREHEPDLFVGAILEGPYAWAVRPVAEAFTERASGSARIKSALVGAIWRVRDGLTFDTGIRMARDGKETVHELRIGLTWAIRQKGNRGMNLTRRLILFSFLSFLALPDRAAEEAPLTPGETIELPNVRGRIDHFGIDLVRSRLYIAALGNDTVEVVDLKAGVRMRSMHGFAEPQGALFIAGLDRLFVANGRGDRVDIIDGGSLARTRRIEELADADNVRLDPAARKVYVGYGKGALRALDAATGDSAGDIPLSGHPEAFQLETNGNRIFVNVPSAHHVAVVDRVKRAVIATWATAGSEANFPMALDEKGRRLFVGTRFPALLLVYDIDTGKVVAKQEIGKDADDIFFDEARKRVYVICGEGRIDIVRQVDPDRYSIVSSMSTAPRARTGLFVPESQRLYVAAPATGASPARVLTYRVH